MSLWRIPFILSATTAFHLAATPPNPPAPPEERQKVDDKVERNMSTMIVRAWPFVYKMSFWVAAATESAVIVAMNYPTTPLSQKFLARLAYTAPSPSRISLSAGFVAGWALTAFGGYIRCACYRALGSLFTYELCIRKDHRLVTSGPYAVVRHPSYTGVVAAVVGTLFLHLSPGTWMREYILPQPFGQFMAGFWTISAAFFAGLMCSRPVKEDKALRAEFGPRWDEWAKEVQWRMVPHLW